LEVETDGKLREEGTMPDDTMDLDIAERNSAYIDAEAYLEEATTRPDDAAAALQRALVYAVLAVARELSGVADALDRHTSAAMATRG
jgi:hypothetical protein